MAKQVTKAVVAKKSAAPMKKMAVKSPSAPSKMPVKSMKIKSDTVSSIPRKRTIADKAKSAIVTAGAIGGLYKMAKGISDAKNGR